jgi:nitrogen regulatory protein PII
LSSELQVVVGFIRPARLDGVVAALRRIPNFRGVSVTEVRGFVGRSGPPGRDGDFSESPAFQPSLRLEAFCLLDDATEIAETIRQAAHTGQAGDGMVFALPVTLAYRVRTSEWAESAVLPSGRG